MSYSAKTDTMFGISQLLRPQPEPVARNTLKRQGPIPMIRKSRDSKSTVSKQELFASTPVPKALMTMAVPTIISQVITIGYATLFLRIRCIASPMQFINYHTSFCMQAMGEGKKTLLHAFVRELVFYIPFMFLLDRLFGETGLAAALPVGETCGAVFALFLLHKAIQEARARKEAKTV
ncbi:MAG: hypothetical protein ABTA22_02660 [Clostridia bacterium]